MYMKYLTSVILLFYSLSIFSQSDKISYVLRHNEKSKCVRLGYGRTSKSELVYTGFSYFFTKKFYLESDLQFEKGEINITKINSYSLKLNSNYSIYNFDKKSYLNLNAGVVGGFERLKNEPLKVDESKFVYAFLIGINNETYIAKNLCLSLGINQNYILKSNLRSFYINGELGIKYFIK